MLQVAPGVSLTGVQVDEVAAKKLGELGPEVLQVSIEDFEADVMFGLAFTKGALIHLDLGSLVEIHRKMHRCSSSCIMIAKYCNKLKWEQRNQEHFRLVECYEVLSSWAYVASSWFVFSSYGHYSHA